MPVSGRDAGLGFIAAALSVAVFHQSMIFILAQAGLIASQPWSLAPVGPLAVPGLVNHMFWGGLWGSVFAWLWPRIAGQTMALKGALFGVAGPLLIGRWLVVPLIKGEPLFAGFNGQTMAAQILIALAFGAGLAWIYGRLSGRGV